MPKRFEKPLHCKLVVVGYGGVGKSSLLHAWATGNFPEPYPPIGVLEDQTVSLRLPVDVVPLSKKATGIQRITETTMNATLKLRRTISAFADWPRESRVSTGTPYTAACSSSSGRSERPYSNNHCQRYTSKHEESMVTIEMKICDTSWTDSRLRPLIYMNADVVLICFSVDRRYSLQFIANDLAEEVRRCCGPGIPVILVGCKTDARDNPNRREDNRNEGWGRMITTEEGEGAAEQISAAHYFEISAKLGQGLEELFKCAAKEGVRYHLASLSKRKK